MAEGLLREYRDLGAVKLINKEDPRLTANWSLAKKSSGGFRLIVDLRPLNEFLPQQHFTCTGVPHLLPHLRQGQWGARLDLANAYLHFRLSKHLNKFCCTEVGGKTWQLTALPFGLSIAPKTFTSFMNCVEQADAHQAHQLPDISRRHTDHRGVT